MAYPHAGHMCRPRSCVMRSPWRCWHFSQAVHVHSHVPPRPAPRQPNPLVRQNLLTKSVRTDMATDFSANPHTPDCPRNPYAKYMGAWLGRMGIKGRRSEVVHILRKQHGNPPPSNSISPPPFRPSLGTHYTSLSFGRDLRPTHPKSHVNHWPSRPCPWERTLKRVHKPPTHAIGFIISRISSLKSVGRRVFTEVKVDSSEEMDGLGLVSAIAS